MGLDMFAYKVKKGLIPEGVEVDFGHPFGDVSVQEDWYWRKNNYLHCWMETLYRSKNGKNECFNCVNIKLNKEDLLSLRKAIKNKTLSETSGFFFGGEYDYYKEEAEDDLKFVDEALEAIKDGMDVYYSSWW